MNLHAKDKTQHPENVELLSAQKPITDFKGLLTTIISAVVCFGIYHILPYSPDANKGIALLIFVAALWFTEAVHITVTALMVLILAVVLGFPDMDIKKAMADFSNPIIYIFFGGFALATALHMQRLDRKIAVSLLRLSRGNMKVAVLMLFLVTAFLSMWISNTATAAMMLPLAMGMLSHLRPGKRTQNLRLPPARHRLLRQHRRLGHARRLAAQPDCRQSPKSGLRRLDEARPADDAVDSALDAALPVRHPQT